MRIIDNYLNGYTDDDGCSEAAGYWSRAGGCLFNCLELLHSATNGGVDLYEVPLIADIGRYIYRAHIHDAWFVNFGDGSAGRAHRATSSSVTDSASTRLAMGPNTRA